jgi:hypothetical protein
VDLAGSEKVGKTGATGDRLKEGKFGLGFLVLRSVFWRLRLFIIRFGIQ